MNTPAKIIRLLLICLIGITSFGGSFTCNSETDTDKNRPNQQP